MSIFVDSVVWRDDGFVKIDVTILIYKTIDFSLGSFEGLEALIYKNE